MHARSRGAREHARRRKARSRSPPEHGHGPLGGSPGGYAWADVRSAREAGLSAGVRTTDRERRPSRRSAVTGADGFVFGGTAAAEESAELLAEDLPPLLASMTPSVWPLGGHAFGVAGVSSRQLDQRRSADGRRSVSTPRRQSDLGGLGSGLLPPEERSRDSTHSLDGARRRSRLPSDAPSPGSPLLGGAAARDVSLALAQHAASEGGSASGGAEHGAAGNAPRPREHAYAHKRRFGAGSNASVAGAFLDHTLSGGSLGGAVTAHAFCVEDHRAYDGAAGAPTRLLALDDMRTHLLLKKSVASAPFSASSSAQALALLGGPSAQPPPPARAARNSNLAGVAGATSQEIVRFERRRLSGEAPPRSPLARARAALATADAVIAGAPAAPHEEAEAQRGRARPAGARADTLRIGAGADPAAEPSVEHRRRLRAPGGMSDGGAGLASAAIHAAHARHGGAHAARNAASEATAALAAITGGSWMADEVPRSRALPPALAQARGALTAGLGSAQVRAAYARCRQHDGVSRLAGELGSVASAAALAGLDGEALRANGGGAHDGDTDALHGRERRQPRAEPATLPVAGAASGARARRPRGRRNERIIFGEIASFYAQQRADLDAQYARWRAEGGGDEAFFADNDLNGYDLEPSTPSDGTAQSADDAQTERTSCSGRSLRASDGRARARADSWGADSASGSGSGEDGESLNDGYGCYGSTRRGGYAGSGGSEVPRSGRPTPVAVDSPRRRECSRGNATAATAEPLAHAPAPSPPPPGTSAPHVVTQPGKRGGSPRKASLAEERGMVRHGMDPPAAQRAPLGLSGASARGSGVADGHNGARDRARAEVRPRTPAITIVPPSARHGGSSADERGRRSVDERDVAQLERLRSARSRAAAAVLRASRDGVLPLKTA
ncbi:hypothetical protein KFE25_007828 [Diacronema lutheri]|uniref:Uncharacterized protein n=1 Tax=Diacronema lutheri TaxID=2081491 RepID=A0A8J6CGN3_DIALT|nr:hypothetical protein KFE25_007828 [Diacronema lutheri]